MWWCRCCFFPVLTVSEFAIYLIGLNLSGTVPLETPGKKTDHFITFSSWFDYSSSRSIAFHGAGGLARKFCVAHTSSTLPTLEAWTLYGRGKNLRLLVCTCMQWPYCPSKWFQDNWKSFPFISEEGLLWGYLLLVRWRRGATICACVINVCANECTVLLYAFGSFEYVHTGERENVVWSQFFFVFPFVLILLSSFTCNSILSTWTLPVFLLPAPSSDLIHLWCEDSRRLVIISQRGPWIQNTFPALLNEHHLLYGYPLCIPRLARQLSELERPKLIV